MRDIWEGDSPLCEENDSVAATLDVEAESDAGGGSSSLTLRPISDSDPASKADAIALAADGSNCLTPSRAHSYSLARISLEGIPSGSELGISDNCGEFSA